MFLFSKYWILRPRHQISLAWNATCFRNNVIFCWIYSIALHTNERTRLGIFVYTPIRTQVTTDATEPRITSWHATPIEAVTCFVYVHTDASSGAVQTPCTRTTSLRRRVQIDVSCTEHCHSHYMILYYIFVKQKYLIAQNLTEGQNLRVTMYDETM